MIFAKRPTDPSNAHKPDSIRLRVLVSGELRSGMRPIYGSAVECIIDQQVETRQNYLSSSIESTASFSF